MLMLVVVLALVGVVRPRLRDLEIDLVLGAVNRGEVF